MTTLAPGDRDPAKMNKVIRQVAAGGTHNNGIVTLRPSQTTTTVAHESANPNSVVNLMPKTASAKTAWLAGYFITNQTTGSFTINHASNAATDQTFGFSCTGL